MKSHITLFAASALCAVLAGASYDARAAFGLTTTANDYTIDTGAGLVFKVQRVRLSRAGIGDISSLIWHGVDVQGRSKGTHIASGFSGVYSGISAVSVVAETPTADHIKVTVQTGGMTHYYVARRNDPAIYMGTHITAEPSVGEFRWITRLNSAYFTGVPPESNLNGTTGAIESSDVFGTADGQTRSKYYGNQRAFEYGLRGVTGSGIGVFMAYDNREGSSGGPFYRDIQNQSGADTELYNYMNSGHNQTEAYRMGFHGPYALLFTDGSTPAKPDMSWVGPLGMTGFVGPEGRGGVALAGIAGRDTRFNYMVGFANSTAQYWAPANAADGSMARAGMLPGSYTMTVYKNELAVDTRPVTINAGATTPVGALTIAGDPASTVAMWRIGEWDGSPKEFLNGDKVNAMHPSDVRMSYWTPPDYLVGTSNAATGFPAYQWKAINGAMNVRFNLRSSQRSLASTYRVRIGITGAVAGARPQIRVNGWLSAVPPSSSQPSSRSLTVGSYRGNNAMFTYTIPASELLVGQNVLTIMPASGSSGAMYLSPGYSYDAVDLIKTP